MAEENTPKRKWSEETISMILGLAMVLLVSAIVIRVVDRNKGKIDIPGVSIENNGALKLESGTGSESNKPTQENENKETAGNSEVKTGTYTVKSGDSLWKIASTHLNNGYRWTEIARLNKITNPGVIWSGMKLIMPVEEKQVVAEEKKLPVMGKDYVVTRGDNLWKIAVAAYGDGYQWPKIWEANKKIVAQPGSLEIGMKLTIPELEDMGDGKGVIK
ncbi:MAG: LysM peptidoglycan-binding domain-containing protein [Candidatus Shapirobacteria bacterium]